MLAVDRVMSTIAEKFSDENMLRDSWKLDGEWKESVAGTISNLMMRGIQRLSFREMVVAQMRFEWKGENSPPEEMQGMMRLIAQKIA